MLRLSDKSIYLWGIRRDKEGEGTSAPQNGIISFGLFLGKSYSSTSLTISYLIITDSSPKYIHKENFSGFWSRQDTSGW